MKCLSCDKILSDREASRKSITTGEHLDLCNSCFEPIRGLVYSEVDYALRDEDYETTVTTPHSHKNNNDNPHNDEE